MKREITENEWFDEIEKLDGQFEAAKAAEGEISARIEARSRQLKAEGKSRTEINQILDVEFPAAAPITRRRKAK